MLTVLSCIAFDHDYRFVALAAAACLIGSWITIRLYQCMVDTVGSRRHGWLFLTSIAAGSTVWTTHFLAMLGFQPDLQTAFDLPLTVASLLIVTGGAALGFWVASLPGRGPAIEFGGAIVGLSIAAMHYTGMMAYRIPGAVEWDRSMVIASLVLSIGLSALALNRSARPVTRWCRYGGVAALVLAICSLHFTGMSAVTIYHDPTIFVPEQGVGNDVLAMLVVGVMAVIVATGFSTYSIDISTRSEALERYRHLALHDTLTRLPNRANLAERLDGLLESGAESRRRFAVVAIDLNRFKEVNDVFGHGTGDRLLAQIGDRFRAVLRPGEFVARVGGDEFIAIQSEAGDRKSVARFARRLTGSIVRPFASGASELTVGASAGISIFPDDGITADELVTRADLALYRAKRSGIEALCFYEPSMDESVRRRSELAMALRTAIQNDELELHYQPQHDVASGEPVGFEALVRWRRGGELVGPCEFIPIAEETGLILDIGTWVLRAACQEAAGWRRPYSIAVNVSPRQISQSDLVAQVHTVLLETGLSARRLELEITESTLIDDFEHTLHVLRQLKALGVRVAMDDFGSGYSSLSTLQAFPFDKIKLDRSLTSKADTNRQAAAILRAVVGLGRSLEIPVLAEGVETAMQLKFLKDEHCDEAQGYFFGRPELISVFHDIVQEPGTDRAPDADPAPALVA